jgi:hypothetical protein
VVAASLKNEDVTFYIRDLDQICLELDYPLDQCWEILAGGN